nr:SURF1 family protein [Motilibacter aurantiacus]
MRTLRQPRWLGLSAVIVVACLVFARLGMWQWHRAEGKWDANDAITAASRAEPVPAGELLSVDAGPAKSVQWRQVTLTGTYRTDDTVLVRNRSQDGERGFHVLVPLQPADGPALLVDRGFVPAGASATTSPKVPAPPTGTVTVVGQIRPAEPSNERQSKLEQVGDYPTVTRIDPARLVPQLSLAQAYAGYVQRTAETPAPAEVPAALDLPEADVGINLAYAFQWFVFIGVALVGWFVLLRRDTREAAQAGGNGSAPTPSTAAVG